MVQDKVKRNIILIAVTISLFLLLIGFTYAFFNYTRTGSENTFRTGRIYFLSEQNNTLNITNLFPIASNELSDSNLDQIEVRIQGDTTYSGGEEYEITIVRVNNEINNKALPINFVAEYTPTATGEVIGTNSNDYFSDRGSTTAVYKLTETGEVKEGKQVLVGYIPRNGDIDGTLKISAYLDESKIAITDTLEGTEGASAEYEYGTTIDWVAGRTVFTTDEWNSLRNTQNPISFKIKAESNEGIWVEEPLPEIESCPGCKYIYRVIDPMDETTWLWTTWNEQNQTPTVLTDELYDNYEELIETTNKNYFLGVKLNNNHEVTNAYACGVKDNVPFCIEGKLYSGLGGTEAATTYAINQSLLQGANLYNNTCTVYGDTTNGYTECGPWDNSGSLSAGADSGGGVDAGVGYNDVCSVGSGGNFGCSESDSGEPGPVEPVPGGGGAG